MKAFKTVLALLLIFLIGMAIYIAVQPNSYEVTRSRTIDAPSAIIYDNVIDFKNWETWSSWIEKKPFTKITYPELTKGIGGSYSWEDDDGVGNMKTLAATPNKSIDQELQFEDYEPSKVNWTFEPTDDGKTNVIWSMKGDNVPFGFRAFAVFGGGFDAMIGPDFERGLEKLDSLIVIEASKQKDMASAYKLGSIKEINLPNQTFIGYKQSTTIKAAMSDMSGLFMKYLPMAGQHAMSKLKYGEFTPGTVYTKWDEKTDEAEFYIGLLLHKKLAPAEGMTELQIPKGSSVMIPKFGNYGVGDYEAHTALGKYIESKNLTQGEYMWELYVNDPTNVKPQEIQTDIYYSLK